MSHDCNDDCNNYKFISHQIGQYQPRIFAHSDILWVLPGRLEVVPVNTSSSYRPFGDDVADILGMEDSVSSPEPKRESTAAELKPPEGEIHGVAQLASLA